MEILLSILAQTTLTIESEEEYEAARDEILSQLESMGFSVNIASEESDDGWLSELDDEHEREDDYYDEEDEDDDEEDEY